MYHGILWIMREKSRRSRNIYLKEKNINDNKGMFIVILSYTLIIMIVHNIESRENHFITIVVNSNFLKLSILCSMCNC